MWQSSNTIRTGHDASHNTPLPGGQYARGWRAEPLTKRRISLWLHGSLFVLSTAAILFSGGLEGPARQDWELRHRVLPRLVLTRAYDGRPKAERLLSPQKLFDLFLPRANPLNPSNPW